jgi:hypothetical protein
MKPAVEERLRKMTTTYELFGKQHQATVTACVQVTDDPDYPADYWLWTLQFVAPIRMYDGSMLHQTFVRRVTSAHIQAMGVAA